jgi:hypothetical protein
MSALAEAVQVFTDVHDETNLAEALFALGEATLADGDPVGAATLIRQARDRCPAQADPRLRTRIDAALGTVTASENRT